MEAATAIELLGSYATEQWGLVTSRQARRLGVEAVTLHRLTAAGLVRPVRHGVHAITAAPASPARNEQAVWLALRPDVPAWERPALDPDGGVVSHRSALRLHDLGDLVHHGVELTVPRRRTSRDPDVRMHRAALDETDVTVLDGLPVTTPSRTIGDLLDQRIDASHIATIIRQSVEAGQTHLDELAERVAPHARHYGAAGPAFLDHLLAHIGLSVAALTVRRSPITWELLRNSGTTWDELADKSITWADLAGLADNAELRRLLSRPPVLAEPDLRDRFGRDERGER